MGAFGIINKYDFFAPKKSLNKREQKYNDC